MGITASRAQPGRSRGGPIAGPLCGLTSILVRHRHRFARSYDGVISPWNGVMGHSRVVIDRPGGPSPWTRADSTIDSESDLNLDLVKVEPATGLRIVSDRPKVVTLFALVVSR